MPESHLHEKLPASVRTHVPDLDTDERQQQPQPPKVSELAQTPTEAILFAELSEAGQNERRLGFHDLPMVEKAVVGDRRALLLTAAPARLYFEFKLGEIEHEIPAASASGKLAVYRKRSQDAFTSAIARLFGILSSWKRDEASQLLSVDIVVLDDTPIESRSKRDRVLDLTLSSDLELLPVVDVIGHIEIKGRGNIRIKPSCKASLLARLPNVGSFELDLGRVPMTLDEALGTTTAIANASPALRDVTLLGQKLGPILRADDPVQMMNYGLSVIKIGASLERLTLHGAVEATGFFRLFNVNLVLGRPLDAPVRAPAWPRLQHLLASCWVRDPGVASAAHDLQNNLLFDVGFAAGCMPSLRRLEVLVHMWSPAPGGGGAAPARQRTLTIEARVTETGDRGTDHAALSVGSPDLVLRPGHYAVGAWAESFRRARGIPLRFCSAGTPCKIDSWGGPEGAGSGVRIFEIGMDGRARECPDASGRC